MRVFLLVCAVCSVLLCSCMSQQMQSESGLYDVELVHSYKVPVDAYWVWGKGNAYEGKPTVSFYVAPLDISAVQEDHPELAPRMVEQMRDLMKKELTQSFSEANAANKTQWLLTEEPSQADVCINLAIVNLRLRRPVLHVIAKVLGYVAPTGVGDAVELIAKGDITLEGTLRDVHNNQLYLAFKDANRAPLRFYHRDTYRRTGHVDANLKLWSEKLAHLFRECAHDRLGNKHFNDVIEGRSVREVISTRVHESL